MTVNTTNVRNTTTGNGVTTSFPFTFRALHPTHIEVYKAGVLQTYITHYTVTFTNPDGETGGTGGSIIFGAAPANGNALSFDRVTPRDQDYDPQYLAGLNPPELENAFDKAILIIQELEDEISGLGGGGGGSGSVTSFSASPTSIFDVANATTTPALSLDNQSANRVLAGPSSGGATTPAFRALVPADMAASGANGEFLSIAGGALDWAVPAVAAGDLQPLFVTSESGLGITFTQITKNANTVFAGPTSGGAANPDFRALVPADLAASGSNGEVLGITAGALDWVSVAGSGTVTSFSATPSGIFDVANATTTPALSLDNQNANIVLAGPSSGGAATPAFRAIVAADLAASGSNGEFLGIVGGVLDWTVPPVAAGDLTPLFTTSESGLGITFSQITKNANTVFAGPTSGGAANPDFRALVPADLAASGANGEVLGITAGALDWIAAGGTGTVTSFSATPSGIFDVANATTTPALSLDNQNANIVLAGPTSGGAATPAFRALVPADLAASGADGEFLGIVSSALDWVVPSVSASNLTPLFTTSESGLGITFSQITKNANLVFAGPSSGGAANPDFRALVPADLASSGSDGEFLGIVGGVLDWATPAGSGTVTSFSAAPTGIFDVANATTTPALSLDNQNANIVLAGPSSGGAATPAFRALVPADLAASGADGEVLGITAGALDWVSAAGGGTVTSFSASPTGIFDVANATSTPALSLDNQNANIVLAGPSSGGAATPAFRSLVHADLAASGANGEFLGIVGGALDWTTPPVSAGDLSPLFTTSESGLGITFALSNASAYNVFGRDASSSGAPAYVDSGQLTRLLPVAKSANFTAAWGESYPVSTAGGNVTCTIPAATGSGKFIYVSHDIAGNTLTIQRTGSDTLSGLTSFTTTVLDDGYLIHDIKSGKSAVM